MDRKQMNQTCINPRKLPWVGIDDLVKEAADDLDDLSLLVFTMGLSIEDGCHRAIKQLADKHKVLIEFSELRTWLITDQGNWAFVRAMLLALPRLCQAEGYDIYNLGVETKKNEFELFEHAFDGKKLTTMKIDVIDQKTGLQEIIELPFESLIDHLSKKGGEG